MNLIAFHIRMSVDDKEGKKEMKRSNAREDEE
jgi:hypothetical protein